MIGLVRTGDGFRAVRAGRRRGRARRTRHAAPAPRTGSASPSTSRQGDVLRPRCGCPGRVMIIAQRDAQRPATHPVEPERRRLAAAAAHQAALDGEPASVAAASEFRRDGRVENAGPVADAHDGAVAHPRGRTFGAGFEGNHRQAASLQPAGSRAISMAPAKPTSSAAREQPVTLAGRRRRGRVLPSVATMTAQPIRSSQAREWIRPSRNSNSRQVPHGERAEIAHALAVGFQVLRRARRPGTRRGAVSGASGPAPSPDGPCARKTRNGRGPTVLRPCPGNGRSGCRNRPRAAVTPGAAAQQRGDGRPAPPPRGKARSARAKWPRTMANNLSLCIAAVKLPGRVPDEKSLEAGSIPS